MSSIEATLADAHCGFIFFSLITHNLYNAFIKELTLLVESYCGFAIIISLSCCDIGAMENCTREIFNVLYTINNCIDSIVAQKQLFSLRETGL